MEMVRFGIQSKYSTHLSLSVSLVCAVVDVVLEVPVSSNCFHVCLLSFSSPASRPFVVAADAVGSLSRAPSPKMLAHFHFT